MLSTLLQLAGFALVVAFFAVIFWPSALLVSGVLLVVFGHEPPVEAKK